MSAAIYRWFLCTLREYTIFFTTTFLFSLLFFFGFHINPSAPETRRLLCVRVPSDGFRGEFTEKLKLFQSETLQAVSAPS